MNLALAIIGFLCMGTNFAHDWAVHHTHINRPGIIQEGDIMGIASDGTVTIKRKDGCMTNGGKQS